MSIIPTRLRAGDHILFNLDETLTVIVTSNRDTAEVYKEYQNGVLMDTKTVFVLYAERLDDVTLMSLAEQSDDLTALVRKIVTETLKEALK